MGANLHRPQPHQDGPHRMSALPSFKQPLMALSGQAPSHQVAEPLGGSSKSGTFKGKVGVPPELDARAKATSAKWHKRLQRELLKIWLGLSALWIGCILAILGQCVYGPWIGWQQLQCDAPLVNPVETYLADFATALGRLPPCSCCTGW